MSRSETDPQHIPLAAIKTHPDLQIRGGTDHTTVKRYAEAMKRGADFPPIRLAQVGENLYVIDGHHRYEAAHRAGERVLKATKRRMSLREAQREAFTANQDHGRRLTRKEQQHAFDAYIAADLHLHEGNSLGVIPGTVKSLRTIAAECPVYTFQSIGRKLKERGIEADREDVKDYDWSYADWEKEWEEDPTDFELEQSSLLSAFREKLDATAASFALLEGASREEALFALRGLVESLRGLPRLSLDI